MNRPKPDCAVKPFYLILNPSAKTAHCEIFTFEPQNIEEAELGTLYCLGQITNPDNDSKHLLNFISSTIKREYFINSRRNPLTSLEAGLHRANMALAEASQQNNINWLGNINMTCASLQKNMLCLTKTGQNQIFLWRDGELIDLGKEFIFNEQKPNPAKTFRNVASGEIAAGDKILLTTPTIFDLLSPSGLKQLLASDSQSAILQIESLAKEQSHLPSLAILLLDLSAATQPTIIENSPSAKKILINEPRQFTLPTTSLSQKNIIANLLSKFILKIKMALKKLINQLQTVLPKLLNKITRHKLVFTARDSKNGQPEKLILSKRKLAALTLIITLAAISIFFTKYNQHKKQTLADYQKAIEKISRQQNEIDTILIFNDVNRASALLLEAIKTANGLKQIDSDRPESADIAKKLQDQYDSINRIKRLPDPKTIYDFSKSNLEFKVQKLFIDSNYLYADAKNPQMYFQYSFGSKQGSYIASPLDITNFAKKPKEQFTINDKGQLIKIAGRQSIIKVNSFPDLPKTATIIYSDNLQNIYILDAANQRIVALNKKGELLFQLVSAAFNTIVDLAVMPDEKTGFALAQNRLFQIEF